MDTIEDIVKDKLGENLRGTKKTYCGMSSIFLLKGEIVLATENGLIKCPAGVIPSGIVSNQTQIDNTSYATSYFKSFAVMCINGDATNIPVGTLVYSKGDGTVTATENGQAFATCKANDIAEGTTTKLVKVEVL